MFPHGDHWTPRSISRCPRNVTHSTPPKGTRCLPSFPNDDYRNRQRQAPRRTGCLGVPAKGQGESVATGLVLGAETSHSTEMGKPGLPERSSRSGDPRGNQSGAEIRRQGFRNLPRSPVSSASVSLGQVSPGGWVCGRPEPVTLQKKKKKKFKNPPKGCQFFILPNKDTLKGQLASTLAIGSRGVRKPERRGNRSLPPLPPQLVLQTECISRFRTTSTFHMFSLFFSLHCRLVFTEMPCHTPEFDRH